MTKNQLLLIMLSEECLEVAHRISKSLRFGLDEQRGQESTNRSRIEEEMIDLLSLIDIVQEAEILDIPTFEVPYDLTRSKREKVEKYLRHSQEVGVLENDK